ncbi:mitochondrial thiamine pyrophosphate carrier-like isoform X3 [Gordionus sp. m RMFG-2023]
MVCQPLDVIKIRLQLQLEPRNNGKYKNMAHAIRLIFKEEGIFAFWKGHMPAQYLSMIYGGVQFATYECMNNFLKKLYKSNMEQSNTPIISFLSGSISGIISTSATFPFDLFKTRLVSQYETQKVYRGILHGANIIYHKEGIKGFYKGLTPSIIQIAPYSGLYFMFYSTLKNESRITHKYKIFENHHTIINFIYGAFSGTLAKIIVYPLDTIKKRLQIQGFEESRHKFGKFEKYRNFIHCISTIKKNEGFMGYYKGLSPTLLKAGLNTGLMFYFYDLFCDIFQHSFN